MTYARARAHAHKAEQVGASSKQNARDTRARAQRSQKSEAECFYFGNLSEISDRKITQPFQLSLSEIITTRQIFKKFITFLF